MASRQQFKEDRAEAAAKLAARDIGDINRANEREEGYTLNSDVTFKQARAEAAAKLAAKDLEDVNRARSDTAWKGQGQGQRDENKPGVIGSMLRAVHGTYEHAKETVVGKPDPSPVVCYSKESKVDEGGSKVGEYTDYAAQKAKETKEKAGEYADYASQKAKDAKDATVNKSGEYKDYTAEKTVEGKDSAVGKLGELKGSAADAAKRAMSFFTGNKEETKVSGREEGERRRMGEVRVQDKEYGEGRGGGEKLVIKLEESRPGAVADVFKAADKAMGGDVEEEGVIHVERRREKM